jgi:hypothetical protein
VDGFFWRNLISEDHPPKRKISRMFFKRQSAFARNRSRLYAPYMRLRAFSLGASFHIEPFAERLLPRSWADHGIFVFFSR